MCNKQKFTSLTFFLYIKIVNMCNKCERIGAYNSLCDSFLQSSVLKIDVQTPSQAKDNVGTICKIINGKWVTWKATVRFENTPQVVQYRDKLFGAI